MVVVPPRPAGRDTGGAPVDTSVYDPDLSLRPRPATVDPGYPNTAGPAPVRVITPSHQALLDEQVRLRQEIARVQALAEQKDPEDPLGRPLDPEASKRLDKLNDDYRFLIVSIRDAEDREAARVAAAQEREDVRADKPKPSKLDKFEQVIDPRTNKVIALRDPSTDHYVDLPGDGAPPAWTEIQQIENPDRTSSFWGLDPADKQYKLVPGLPTVPRSEKAPPGWGSIQNRRTASGATEMWGFDPKDNEFKRIPGAEPEPPLVAEGKPRPVITPDGDLAWEVFRSGAYEPDPSRPPVPFTLEAKSRAKKFAAEPEVGQRYPDIQGGQVVETYWDGQRYRIDKNIDPQPFGALAKDEQERLLARARKDDTRKNTTADGRAVVERYDGQEWVVDPELSTFKQVAPKTYAPGSVSAPGTERYITRTDETGKLVQTPNAGFAPKTAADVAFARSNLQAQAEGELQRLKAKIKPGLYEEAQADADFNKWMDQKEQELRLVEQDAQREQQRLAAEQQRANYSTAQGAGTNVVNAYNAQKSQMVGPGFAEGANEIMKAWKEGRVADVDVGKMSTFQLPDLNAMSEQAVARALQTISPMAQQLTGAQAGQLPAPADGLNRTNYAFGGPTGGLPALAPVGPAAGYPSPEGTSPGWDLASGPQNFAQQPTLPVGAAGVPVANSPAAARARRLMQQMQYQFTG